MRYAIVLSTVLLGVGCAHQSQVKQATLPTAGSGRATKGMSATNAGATCASDLDCAAGQLCVRGGCVAITPGLAACQSVRVHFPFNSSELAATDEAQLQRSARCLEADRALRVKIEGNADERGTEEYNLALGDRRANAVSRYFAALGVSRKQLATVSYGKENPICEAHDEACWSQNRRADLDLE